MERTVEEREGQRGQEPHRKRQRISEDPVHQKRAETEDHEDVRHQAAEMQHRMPKGYRMMIHMGYRAGAFLGSQETNKYNTTRLKSPIELEPNLPNDTFDREKRSFPDATAEEQFRLWTSTQQNGKKNLNIWRRMQKLAFEMSGDADICLPNSDPRDFNVLWRPYVRELIEVNRQEPLVEEPDTDEDVAVEEKFEQNVASEHDDACTCHSEPQDSQIEIESVSDHSDDGDDEELKSLYEMDVNDRLMKLHIFLRCELNYCYYCGVKYEDEQDLYTNCPGLTEAEHD